MILCLASVAQAQYRPYPHHHHHHGGNGWGWVAPALIGGAIVYGLTHTPPPPPPQAVVVVPPGYPVPPPGYRYDQILDANCSCYRWVLVQAY
jgi:hypothetical protein